jgi:deferrochelatase/peroxidase EfeB
MSNGAQDPNAIQPEDLKEIQGIVLRGYTFEFVRHFVLTIEDAGAFKKFLGSLVPGGASAGPLTVTSAETWTEKPDYTLAIGLSFAGIQALGLPAAFGNTFQYQAFKQGAVARAPIVFDTGSSAPANWVPCLAPSGAPAAHAVVTLYAKDEATLESRSQTLRGMFGQDGAARALSFGDADHFDGRALPDGMVHFGYADGISQPNVMGVPRPPDKQQPVPAYEVVLRNTSEAPYPFPFPEAFGNNSSFGAFRILEQDVYGFETYLENSSVDTELLAAKFCGRWRNGNPLELQPDAPGDPLPPDQLTDFDYFSDPEGLRCPIGSHTRRANPRDAESFPSSKPDHRIVRRAMPYGPAWDASQGKDDVPRGLVGYFIGASLENTFEFIMQRWINGQNFADNFSEPQGNDPVLGANATGSSDFEYPPDGKVTGFEEFVTTRGGLYCMLPSLPSLAWMASQ